ncbi:MAG: O-antigen ligase family protein [Lachnospiraceae bacterium]
MKEKMRSILQSASTMWVITIFAVGVFYIDDYYFNLLEAKAMFCDMAALIFLAVSFFGAVLYLMEQSAKENRMLLIKDLHPMDVAVFGFMLAAILSNLVTQHPTEAFWGSYGWSVGTLWVVMMGLVYFFVSRSMQPDRRLFLLIGIAAGLQFLLVIANGFWLDPFSLHQNLAAKDYVRYVGTVGNTNWYVGYVTMMVPFFLMGTGKEQPLWEKILCRILLFLASMTCITINSQGVYLGVGAVLAAYVYLSLAEYEKIRNALINLMVILAGIAAVGVGSFFFTLVDLDGLNPIVIRPVVWGSAMVLCMILYLGLTLLKEDRFCKMAVWMKRIYLLLVTILAVGLVVSQVQSFDDSWGTNRGRTWRVAVQAFTSMPLVNKLFGGGTNCFGFYYLAQTGSDWVRNAHNEYLEYLVTTGLFGMLSYVGIYVSAFADRVRRKTGKGSTDHAREGSYAKSAAGKALFTADLHTACGLAILGYAFQALVNNPQALNGAMLVTILAIYRRTGQKMVE